MAKEPKKEEALVEAEGTLLMEHSAGESALDILTKHAESAPYDPGFMPIKANKGAKSFNAGALGTLDGPIECVIMSVNHRRGLWPPKADISTEQLAAALECMPDDIGKYNLAEVDAWRGKRPLCGSSGNGGVRGEMSKILDADAPDIVEKIIAYPMTANFSCGKCKWEKFGSDWTGGAGKACKETRMLLLYFLEGDMAATLSVTPSSIRHWKSYKTSLPKQNFSKVFTQISTSSVSQGGYDFNVVEFEPSKEGGVIVPVLPQHVASLGERVTYGGRECYKLEALYAEFLNIELEDEQDDPTNGTVEESSQTPFDDKDEDF